MTPPQPLPSGPEAFLEMYARATNTHRFDEVAPLIAEEAVFWFNDGSFHGRDAIRRAFERTWAVIQEESYTIEDVQWLSLEGDSAACIYTFHWRGLVDGAPRQGSGRGTSVLRKVQGQWQVVHEHLSGFP